ncbi:hypothetical protein CAAN1_02S06898 [[Candida] anglica]|uniref:ATPase expression protein 1 n=1 Tax=[Candida] anglica TaxID=148631 RepID=A0ABP0EDV4_9ASCO
MYHKVATASRIRVAATGRRCYSYAAKSALSFIPNDDQYKFDFEKLTPEENRASIQRMPKLENLPKYHNEILSPEFVADLVVDPNFNDVFVTSLAYQKPFSGDQTYKVVSKNYQGNSSDNKVSSEVVNLYFENLTCRWIDTFKDQIYTLSDLSELEEPMTYSSRTIEDQISSAIDKFQQKNPQSMYPQNTDDLNAFFQSLKIFENNSKKMAGILHHSEVANLVTFEHVVSYLFNKIDDTDGFVSLVSFVQENLDMYTQEGLKQTMDQVVTALDKSNSQERRVVFSKFVSEYVLQSNPQILSGLSTNILDKLANIFFVSSNYVQGKEVLNLLILDHRTAPSRETFYSLLAATESNLISIKDKEAKREQVLKDLAPFKSIIFHRGLEDLSLKIILDNAITNSFELHHLIKLAESTPQGRKLLSKYQTDLILGLKEITSDSLPQVRSLELAQLLRLLVVDNTIVLSQDSKNLLKE